MTLVGFEPATHTHEMEVLPLIYLVNNVYFQSFDAVKAAAAATQLSTAEYGRAL